MQHFREEYPTHWKTYIKILAVVSILHSSILSFLHISVKTREISSAKGGSAVEKFTLLVQTKFVFFFSCENFLEFFLLLQYLEDCSFYFTFSVEKVRKSEPDCNESIERVWALECGLVKNIKIFKRLNVCPVDEKI